METETFERSPAGASIPSGSWLLDNIDDAVIGVDDRYVVTTWSRGAERLYGWSAADVIGTDLRSVLRFEMSDADRAAIRRETERAGRMRTDAVAYRKDGSVICVELINVALRDEDGHLTGFLGIHRDVTERTRWEREQQRLVAVVQASSEFIGMADLNGQVHFVNPAGRRLLGITDGDDVTRTHVLDYFMPEDRAFVEESVVPLIAGGGRWSGERFDGRAVRLRHFATGEPIPVYWDGFRLDDPRTGEPFGMAAVARDVAERERANETLRAAQRRTETILESITDAFYALDRDWRLTYLNERALQTFMQLKGEQLTRDDVLGQIIWDVFPGVVDTPAHDAYEQAIRRGQTVVFDYLYPPDGPWFEVHAYPSEQGLSVYFREITARKRAEGDRERWGRQQAIVADLGLRALESDCLESLMDEAARAASRGLDVDLVAIAELGQTATMTLRAGVGWRAGEIGVATSSAGRGSLVGYTAMVGEPVVSEDVRADERFAVSPFLARYDPVSAVSVPIARRDETYGALGAFTTERRPFSDDDANFLRAIANVVSTALEHADAARKLREVREDERSRIARDLHDEALRDLAYALVQAGRAQASAGDAEAAGTVAELVPALTRVGEQLRGAIYDLRLAGEERRPFRELLRGLVDVHRAMADGCDVDLAMSEGVPGGSLGARGTEVLRVVGEALTNARRHSNARSVRVAAWGSRSTLTVEVMDDGSGFDPAAPAAVTGTGIKGMRERAAGAGGELSIRSEPGGGTAVRLRVTLADGQAKTGQGVRVLLVEDHAAVREAIAAAFDREIGFDVAGQAASLTEARGMLEDVDVALIDLALPDGYGGDLIRELREASPRAQALVLSGTLDRAAVARAVQSGAAGALNKTVHLHEVVGAVRRLRAGQTLMPVSEVVELLRFAERRREQEEDDLRALGRLTPREREVLQALADGLDSQQIADRLFISIRTQRNHMSNILAKLGVHSQLQALVFALRHDVVQVGSAESPPAR